MFLFMFLPETPQTKEINSINRSRLLRKLKGYLQPGRQTGEGAIVFSEEMKPLLRANVDLLAVLGVVLVRQSNGPVAPPKGGAKWHDADGGRNGVNYSVRSS